MKTMLLTVLTVAITLSAGAQMAGPSSGSRLPPEQLLRQFDRDGDGKLSQTEAPERMRQRWNQIDTDGDGSITRSELQARDARVAGLGERGAPSALPPTETGAATPVAAAFPGTRAYVNAAAVRGKRDGKSWATAFATVQEALKSGAAEIWVARGTYTPGTDRNATFQLLKGGALLGGFAGNEIRFEQRDWQKNATVLDGRGASHVVTGADDAVLDGFTITGGQAMGGGPGGLPGGMGGRGGSPSGGMAPMGMSGPPGGEGGGRPIHTTPQAVLAGSSAGSGGGMLNVRASPTVRNCIFENNQAGKGGAVYNMTSTSFPPRPEAGSWAPVFINCVFRHNTARVRGGGVSNDLGTSPTFLNCVFEANATQEKGGGMYNDFGCSPTLINCLFTGNQARSAAGMGNDGGSSPVLYFCTFTKNHAIDYGAPLYLGTGPASNPALIGCRIADNQCDWEDPGIYTWHDNRPVIKDVPGGDSGYAPARFAEAHLPRLLAELAPYRPRADREPAETPPERIPISSRVVYVRAAAAGGDGRSWETAYASLPPALADAGKDGAEVRVDGGTYRVEGDRSASFVLLPGVRLVGGFHGAERDPARYPTILDGHGAYHVLVGANGAALDGFTITGGCADGEGYDGKGGGLINYRRAPQSRPNAGTTTGFAMTITGCTFTNNYARDGGAVYSYDRARPVFTACVFSGNRAENGGAVLDRVGVESKFENCEFSGNTARWRGGAVYFDYGSRPAMSGCVFRGNRAGAHGGAVFSVSRASQLENTRVTLTGCRFEGNTARGKGGAAAFCDQSIAVVQACAFSGNQAGKEGADVYRDESSSSSEGDAVATEKAVPETASAAPAAAGRAGGAGRRGAAASATTFQPTAPFSVILIGTGSPQYDPQRAGPSALIQYRGRFVLVDMGNGVQSKINELGVSLRDVAALIVTHHHLDHTEEFIAVLLYRLLRGGAVDVIGPPGTSKMTDFARDFYSEDMAYRMSRQGRSTTEAARPTVREVRGGEAFDLAGLHVATTNVNHTIHTVAYRFEAEGHAIVISGDLTYSDSLIALAHNADVLVIDSGGSIVRSGAARRPEAASAHNDAHASAAEIADMAVKSGVKTLVLTHIAPGDVDEEATVKALGERFPGRVQVGRDLLEIAPGKP